MIIRRIKQFLVLVSLLSIFGFLIFNFFINGDRSRTSSNVVKTSQNLDEDDSDNHYRTHNNLGNDTNHLIWFLQISDLHLSEFHDKSRITDFEIFCNETIKLIKPKVVLVTGDITDAKKENRIGSDQFENEWKAYYSSIVKNNILDTTVWLDIRGNHDNFNIPSAKSSNNFFNKYGVMGKFDRSYKYELNMPSGDNYVFIGVDGNITPGPKRPFNFFGALTDNDVKKLQSYANEASSATGTIWFGHFPVATVSSRVPFREIMSTGVAYLSGHLHTLGGMLESFYTIHPNGLLELELSDWKVNREIRLMAFDAGIFSFKDYFVKDKQIYVLITNPKDMQFKSPREKTIKQVKYSKYIRMLIFSKSAIRSVDVYIDDQHVGKAQHSVDANAPLYLLAWDPSQYQTHIHTIKVVVEDVAMNIEIDAHEFSLDETIIKPFPMLSTWLLTSNSLHIAKSVFHTLLFSILIVLVFFRFYRRRASINFVTCGFIRSIILTYLRRFVLLSSINYIFVSMIFMSVYVAIGPWFIGEILDHHYGTCFIWGIYVKNTLLSGDVQYLSGFFHLLFFQIPLMFHFSFIIETRFQSIHKSKERQTAATNILLKPIQFLWFNIAFLLAIVSFLIQSYELYVAYSAIAVIICPYKTWFLIFSFYLRHRCFKLNEYDFDAFSHAKGNTIVNRIPTEYDDTDLDDTR